MTISLKTAIKSSYGDKKSKQKIINEGYVKDKNYRQLIKKSFIIKILEIYYLMLLEVDL